MIGELALLLSDYIRWNCVSIVAISLDVDLSKTSAVSLPGTIFDDSCSSSRIKITHVSQWLCQYIHTFCLTNISYLPTLTHVIIWIPQICFGDRNVHIDLQTENIPIGEISNLVSLVSFFNLFKALRLFFSATYFITLSWYSIKLHHCAN